MEPKNEKPRREPGGFSTKGLDPFIVSPTCAVRKRRMTYPEDLSRSARARIVHAKIKARQVYLDSLSEAGVFPLGIMTRYVMTIFAAFAKEACGLARSGVWGVDRVELEVSKWIYLTVLFADTDVGIQGERFQHFLTPNGMAIKSEILATLKQEPQWKQYEEELLEVSEIQGVGIETEHGSRLTDKLTTSETIDTGQEPTKTPREHRDAKPEVLSGKAIVSRKLAAEALGVTVRTIDRLVADKKLRPTGDWGRKRFSVQELMDFITRKTKRQPRQSGTK